MSQVTCFRKKSDWLIRQAFLPFPFLSSETTDLAETVPAAPATKEIAPAPIISQSSEKELKDQVSDSVTWSESEIFDLAESLVYSSLATAATTSNHLILVDILEWIFESQTYHQKVGNELVAFKTSERPFSFSWCSRLLNLDPIEMVEQIMFVEIPNWETFKDPKNKDAFDRAKARLSTYR